MTESNQLTAKKAEFSEWYHQVLHLADILDQRYELKGMFVWRPYGYKAMMLIKQHWDKLFQDAGIQETYFPLIVPVEYCQKNPSWWEKFQAEGYKVIAGKDNKIQGALRPTGEPAMYPMFSLWVRTTGDLPIRIYETTSSFRYETKNPRPLIRDMEITVWHEIHTAHATREESEQEMQLHIKMWDQIWRDLCIPTWKIKKPVWECFPGAVGGIEYYNTMPTAKVLETGSVNNLGQAYAKKFDIQYADEKGEKHHVWQVCTGVGARLLAAALAIHGDDKGFIMPPKYAPIEVVIVPIMFKGKEAVVSQRSQELYELLKSDFRVKHDDRSVSAGSKFYDWEIKGVPLRIEIGPRDVERNEVTLVRRDTGEKEQIPADALTNALHEKLAAIEDELLVRATAMLHNQMVHTQNIGDVRNDLGRQRICIAPWCGAQGCFDQANNLEPGVEALGSSPEHKEGRCFACDKDSQEQLYIAKTY